MFIAITSGIGLVFEFMQKAKHSRGFKVLLQFQHSSSFCETSKPCPGSSWEARESSTSKKVRLFMPQSFFNFCSSSLRSRRPRSFYSAQRAQVVSPALGFFSASLVNGRGKNTHPHRVGRRRLSPTEAYSMPPSPNNNGGVCRSRAWKIREQGKNGPTCAAAALEAGFRLDNVRRHRLGRRHSLWCALCWAYRLGSKNLSINRTMML